MHACLRWLPCGCLRTRVVVSLTLACGGGVQSITVNANDGLPAWWVPGVHDGELLNGLLEHGWGAWAAIQVGDAKNSLG